MNRQSIHDQNLSNLANLAGQGIYNAVRGFSGMVGEEISVSNPVIRLVPLAEIPHLLGGPEVEAVGIYLHVAGDLTGQMMLVVPYTKVMELVDLVLGAPAGTTQQLGRLERSALAELGNLTSSYFLNSLAFLAGVDMRPSPPAVLVDMIGAILDVILTSLDGPDESVLMIEATFLRGGREAQANLWVIPDHSTLEAFARREFL